MGHDAILGGGAKVFLINRTARWQQHLVVLTVLAALCRPRLSQLDQLFANNWTRLSASKCFPQFILASKAIVNQMSHLRVYDLWLPQQSLKARFECCYMHFHYNATNYQVFSIAGSRNGDASWSETGINVTCVAISEQRVRALLTYQIVSCTWTLFF